MKGEDVSTYFPGLDRKTAIQNISSKPQNVDALQYAPCDPLKNGGICVMYVENCLGTTSDEINDEKCVAPNDRGFCGNIFEDYEDTGQPVNGNTCLNGNPDSRHPLLKDCFTF